MKYPDVTAGQTEAMINIIGGWDKFQQVLRGELSVTLAAVVKSILALINTVTVPATKQFVAKADFRVGQNGIGWLGENFKTWFLGKTEGPAEESILRYYKLTHSSLDIQILMELGDKAETTLANIFHLLSLQANGQSGVLLTNGRANIFYVRDARGELRTVCARWGVGFGDWGVRALEVTDPDGWNAGNRVFSRA